MNKSKASPKGFCPRNRFREEEHLYPHLNNDQIDELLQAARQSELNETTLRDPRQHLEECASCQSRMRAHEMAMEQIALLKPVVPGSEGPQCPPEGVWLDMAAGLTSQEAEDYLSHAAQCDRCGGLLRQAKEDFADDLTPEEAHHVASLPSADTDWQRRLAHSISVVRELTAPTPQMPQR